MNTPMAFEMDLRARREALDVDRSLLLQAPAGSGKTTVLTARFLALLGAVDAPEQILAITFTRKAAAEMRHRILTALQAAEAGEPIAGIDASVLEAALLRDRARGWQLLRNPARLRVETIDALNHTLAAALPVAAGSGTALRINSAPMPLYRRAARRALYGALQDSQATASAQGLFARLDNNWSRLEQLLAEMLQGRSHWLPRMLDSPAGELAERVDQSLSSALRAQLARVVALLPAPLLREAEALLAHSERVRGIAVLPSEPAAAGSQPALLSSEPTNIPRWRALCELALTDKGSWRRRLTVREGFGPADKAMKQRAVDWIEALAAQPGAEAMLAQVRALPDAALSGADRAALADLALLLSRAAAELQLVFAETGTVDYAYVAAAARQALSEQGEPSELALKASDAVRHLLVDEFQDTSLEQFELLRALTAGWEPGDGRTVFLVGDPMQSIYQFREAEVGLFLRARDHGVGEVKLEPLQLRRNFRSTAPLIAWFNGCFEQLFPAEDDARLAAVRYLPSAPAADDAGGQNDAPVTLHRLEPGDVAGEAERVVAIVREARARRPEASIAVLVASRQHAAAIVGQLQTSGFALRGVDLELLQDRAVIRDVSSLARALQHGADRTAWLAVLRAPWCGLRLSELEAWLSPSGGDVLAELRARLRADGAAEEAEATGTRQRIERVCAALEPAISGAECALPLWERVERCWLRLGGPVIHSSEIERLDARRFMDALALHDAPDILVGEAMSASTERLYSSAPPQPGAIEIMTMHAAKGLEWDVVILPSLGRRSASDTDPLLHWIELPRASQGTDLLLAPIRATDEDPECSLSAYIKDLRRERALLERVRQLYVAATRARTALHLLGALESPGADDSAAPARGSLLSVLWPAIGTQFAALSSAPAARHSAGTGASAPPLRRLPPAWALPVPPQPPAFARLPISLRDAVETPEYSWVGVTARAMGTIVHAELQRIAAAAVLPEPSVLEDKTHHYDGWLAELGVPQREHAAARDLIREALQRTLNDPRGRWLLSNAHVQAHSEWRLSGLHEGRVVNVVFDRMLLEATGQRWIVDFKTSRHEGGGLSQFLDSELERYRGQLERYAALAAQLGPEAVHVALYFPLLGAFRELRPQTVPAKDSG